MHHCDLLDSPSHGNIQERRGKDGWGTILGVGLAKKRNFHGNGEGEWGRYRVLEAVIMVRKEGVEDRGRQLWVIH